jgi:hypothetical protein
MKSNYKVVKVENPFCCVITEKIHRTLDNTYGEVTFGKVGESGTSGRATTGTMHELVARLMKLKILTRESLVIDLGSEKGKVSRTAK